MLTFGTSSGFHPHFVKFQQNHPSCVSQICSTTTSRLSPRHEEPSETYCRYLEFI